MITMEPAPKIYTVKFSIATGSQSMKDYTALGTSDAQTQWRREFPDALLIGIFRKS